MNQHKIAVLGAGNMGTAIAQLLASSGHKVNLWDYNPQTIKAIKKFKINKDFLPGIKLSSKIEPVYEIAQAVDGAKLVVAAVASPHARAVVKQLKIDKNTIVAHVVKGLEKSTGYTMHEVIQQELPKNKVVTISGPSIANEFARGVPTAVVAASQDHAAVKKVIAIFSSPTFKVYPSLDVKGVSLCGVLKNVYAIALGICDGLEYTMNTKSWMFSLMLAEMADIVAKLGGDKKTVYGLAGVGDLMVTGLGDGRNRAYGEQLCKNVKTVNQTCEGIEAVNSFYQILRQKKIKAPLIELLHRVIFKGADPCESIAKFFKTLA